MSILFEPAVLGGISLRNRIVRSATWEGMCDPEGAPTERLIALYEALAEGGVGLILSGYAFVLPEGRQTPGMMGMHDDALVPPLRELTRRVHAKGGTIAAQLVHAGGQANRRVSGLPPVGPSAVSLPHYEEPPQPLSPEEIQRVVEAFGRAAARAKEAGFDGVQLHGAHGYLIGQFLSPRTNRRENGYGGSLPNRARFAVEVVSAVRNAVGKDYPVWIKQNGDDFLDGGLSIEESVEAARILERAGIDAIEVSGGTPGSGAKSAARTRIDSVEKEGYHRAFAKAIKTAVRVPVGVVGGLRTPSLLEEILRSGDADFVSMARPFIREPGLVRRWMAGDTSRAACISCNGCFLPGIKEGGIYCVVERKLRERSPQS
ncbi:MAG: NADH:flavin oxidoreductase [Deltaproteobacteria bacterium]